LPNDRTVESFLSRLNFLQAAAIAVTRSSGRMSRRPATKVWWHFSRACLLDNSITIVSQAPSPSSDNSSLDARMGYRAIAGPPGKTAAYQSAMSLYQRAVTGCGGTTLTSTLLRRVPPVPRRPEVALTRKAETPRGLSQALTGAALRGAAVHPGSRPAPRNPDNSGHIVRRAGRLLGLAQY
jgi:hypothetical protein